MTSFSIKNFLGSSSFRPAVFLTTGLMIASLTVFAQDPQASPQPPPRPLNLSRPSRLLFRSSRSNPRQAAGAGSEIRPTTKARMRVRLMEATSPMLGIPLRMAPVTLKVAPVIRKVPPAIRNPEHTAIRKGPAARRGRCLSRVRTNKGLTSNRQFQRN